LILNTLFASAAIVNNKITRLVKSIYLCREIWSCFFARDMERKIL